MKRKYLLIALLPCFLLACKNEVKKGVYEGKDISEEASIIRDSKTKNASLSINADGKWKLYAGGSTDAIDYSKAFEGDGRGIFLLDVSNTSRSYFQLITADGKAILSDSHLPMEGGYNFRDLGGIRNKDGKYVKWGVFFRTDDLSNLTEGDLNYLSSIPITSVVDFRTKAEIASAPDKLPASVKNYYELNISPGNLDINDTKLDLSKIKTDSIMIEMNKAFVCDTAIINTYRKFFTLLQNENNLSLIFHCSAGKDRTGMGAALILFALGVDEETVIKDYMLSNTYLSGKYDKLMKENPALEPMFTVRPEYLQTSIDIMKNDYGGIDNYLEKELGVNIKAFREKYLY
ncbi:MAG: tyrosine-protein phosphatase [Dysgonomonas sp.]